jgi:hypothetical protein
MLKISAIIKTSVRQHVTSLGILSESLSQGMWRERFPTSEVCKNVLYVLFTQDGRAALTALI